RVLKLGRAGGEKLQLVALNQAINETMALLKFESEKHQIEIEEKLELEEDRILARENDIRMVILNLAKNAFNAMPQGGKLSIHTWQDNHKIYMRFTDTGCGIHSKHLPLIFNPFFSHRTNQKSGTGLGLSICKTLIENYGGRIEVTSQLQHGCQFTVIFSDKTGG
ncbi:ATP-binding protein, partial [Candidatus Marithioploca araucensis]|nr:ATP-binding protein [Candidatus Marithioploca araucensis]